MSGIWVNLDDLRKNYLEARRKLGDNYEESLTKASQDSVLLRETFQIIVVMSGIQALGGKAYLIQKPEPSQFPDFRVVDLENNHLYQIENVRVPSHVVQNASTETDIAQFIFEKKPPYLLGSDVMLAVYGDFTKRGLNLDALSTAVQGHYQISNDIWMYFNINPEMGDWLIHRLNPAPITNKVFHPF